MDPKIKNKDFFQATCSKSFMEKTTLNGVANSSSSSSYSTCNYHSRKVSTVHLIYKGVCRILLIIISHQALKMGLNINGSWEEKQKLQDVTVVMVPLPAQGHLNQLLHFSRLISSYGIPVHYLGTAVHNRQAKTRIHGWDPIAVSNLHFLECPTPSFKTPPPNPRSPTKFPSHLMPAVNSTLLLREPIYEILKSLAKSAKKLIVIHDSFMRYVIQDVPSIPNAESYCFDCCSAFTIYSYFWEVSGRPEINIPEAQLLLNRELPSRETCVSPEWTEYSELQKQSRKINWGNIFNSCKDIDGPFLDLLAKEVAYDTDKYWALGPFNPVIFPEGKRNEIKNSELEWLDKQAPNSVILVSFGTTTSLTEEEIHEIAIGLEKSEQKFIWVLRDADTGDIFKEDEEQEARKKSKQLPEGYEQRINETGKGMIVRNWAPQLEILANPSTGGFMSHCGWNSTVESISMGVPIAAWPMHSDQPRNAILITEYLKIGVNVRDWSRRDEVVKSETIENAVRKLMDSSEGKEMRNRAAKLSHTIKKSVEEGGNTRLEMDSFISHIRK